MGDRERAARLFADVQHLRLDDGGYWTGLVYPEDVNWPVEQTTFTAAAVVLAADALADATAGADIFRGRTLVPHVRARWPWSAAVRQPTGFAGRPSRTA